MKSFLVLTILALSAVAFAKVKECPSLAGTYVCDSALGYVVSQELNPQGKIIYSITWVYPKTSGANQTHQYVAESRQTGNSPVIGDADVTVTCSKGVLDITERASLIPLASEVQYHKDQNGNLIYTEGFNRDGSYEVNRQYTCAPR